MSPALERRALKRLRLARGTLQDDGRAAMVLGVQSVPAGLATGLLAGVNPIAGLNGYLLGTLTGAMVTSSTFMAVQGTGAMAMIVADSPGVQQAADPSRAVFTLSILTGCVMMLAGALKLGSILRFVSNAVTVGFISAVGVDIVLGQLSNLTGYEAHGPNRLARAYFTVVHPGRLHWPSIAMGLTTIVLIILLERTALRALGMVVAGVIASAAAALFGWTSVTTLKDTGVAVDSLPTPAAPSLRLIPVLAIPALALAFVGLVQGAAITANYPNPGGRYPDASRDFLGQGAANVVAGIFRGMPVGGSVSASSLNKAAGARSRLSLVLASVVMAVVIVAFGSVIGRVAMPALAGLLILVGFRTVSLGDLVSVWRVGTVQKAVLLMTFILTVLIPLQYAVLAGVGLSFSLHVVRQSNRLKIKQWTLDARGDVVECDPPKELPGDSVVVLQPYGSLFFASASLFEETLPAVTRCSRNCVVILRLRRRSDLGTTFMDVLLRYAQALANVCSKLVIVSADERLREQFDVAGLTAVIGEDNIYRRTERVGGTVRRAASEAADWVAANRSARQCQN